MLRLFKSFFTGSADKGERYPEHLIQEAMYRGVDATDSRLRALPGYQKRLRPAVLSAIDHVVALVEQLAAPVDASLQGYAGEPRLRAQFSSARRMLEVFGADPSLATLRSDGGLAGSEVIFALMVAEMRERTTFGMELHNDMVQREILQQVVDFPEQRLVDPTAIEADTRRLLMRRAFDHLLELALGRIVATQETREGLERERRLLRRKLNALKSGGWGFDAPADAAPHDTPGLERQLAGLEEKLREVGADGAALTVHLDTVCEVIGSPAEQLWLVRRSMILDRMGVKRETVVDDTTEIVFDELHNASGRSVVTLPVQIPSKDLPPPVDLLTAARPYL